MTPKMESSGVRNRRNKSYKLLGNNSTAASSYEGQESEVGAAALTTSQMLNNAEKALRLERRELKG